MARKGRNGRHIISAGEVGVYTVCPEAWRLQYVARKNVEGGELAEAGKHEHARWAKTIDQAMDLVKWVRYLIYLLATAVIITLLLGWGRLK